jgi:acetolactate synthase-1/2/3 large subunit
MAAPRGPVHLVVAADVVGEPALPVATDCRPAPLPPPQPAALDALAGALAAAARPLLVTGLECDRADVRWIRALAETLPAPVLATTKGRGALAEPHPLALGPLGPGHPVLARTDLVILLGVDAAELAPTALPAGVPIVRIGRTPWSGPMPAAEARGDLALVIEELAPAVRARPAADWDVAELDRLKRAQRATDTATPAARVVALVHEATPAGTLVAADVPALAAWQAVGPRETLTTLGPAPPGYAVLAALAAQLQRPDRRAVAFTGAADLGPAAAGLARATALGLPLVTVRLGALDPAAADRLDTAGVPVTICDGMPQLAAAFAQVWPRGLPALLAVDLERAAREPHD